MSTPPSYFEDMYRTVSDPWHLTERWYERRKYDLTLAALPRPRYRRAFEPACSVGELTSRLAERCDSVVACDRVRSATDTAAHRNRAQPHVEIRHLTLPGQWPEGTFDLIVLSELLYYFDHAELTDLLNRAVSALEEDGTLIAVHWNHQVAEHLRTGREIAEILSSVPELVLACEHHEADFTLQTFGRRGTDGTAPRSPAAAEGLA
ncbi:class I SAM-dependent methyltransferase [Streptomyces sp. NPDC006296]|uniref:class I SAM-dependent methyltransferase n=1 Tax=Streptomyces sp. NPDC006296 TaxID=3156746 RepID=UPI0033A1A602